MKKLRVKVVDTDLSREDIMDQALLLSLPDLEALIRKKGGKIFNSIPEKRQRLSEAIKGYKDEKFPNKPHTTQNSYGTTFGQFKRFIFGLFGYDPFIDEIDSKHIREFLDSLCNRKGQKIALPTEHRKLNTLKSLFSWCKRRRKLNTDSPTPAHETEIHELKQLLPKALTPKGAKRFIELTQATKRKKNKLRDEALIALMIYMGPRVGEVAGLKVKDINFELKEIRFFGKGAKEREVPIFKDLEPILRGYLRESGLKNCPDKTVFGIGSRRIQELVKSLASRLDPSLMMGSGNFTPHCLRHTFAVLCLLNGISIAVIREYLGHNYLSTTQQYTKLDIAQKREILNKHFTLDILKYKGGFDMSNDFVENKYCKFYFSQLRLAKKTVKNYKPWIKRLFDFLGEAPVEIDLRYFITTVNSKGQILSVTPIDTDTIKEFIDTIPLDQENKRHTAVSSLKSFFRILCCKGGPLEGVKDPTKGIKIKKPKRPIPRDYVTPNELNLLLQAARNTKYPYLLQAIILILFATGIRISELINLHQEDFIEELKMLVIPPIKVKREYEMPLRKEVFNYLSAFIENEKTTISEGVDYLFVKSNGKKLSDSWVRNQLRLLCLTAGIDKKITCHSMRHSFARNLYTNGVDLDIVRQMLNQEDIGSTQYYVGSFGSHLKRIAEDNPFSKMVGDFWQNITI